MVLAICQGVGQTMETNCAFGEFSQECYTIVNSIFLAENGEEETCIEESVYEEVFASTRSIVSSHSQTGCPLNKLSERYSDIYKPIASTSAMDASTIGSRVDLETQEQSGLAVRDGIEIISGADKSNLLYRNSLESQPELDKYIAKARKLALNEGRKSRTKEKHKRLENLSVSERAGMRLFIQAIERQNRLASLQEKSLYNTETPSNSVKVGAIKRTWRNRSFFSDDTKNCNNFEEIEMNRRSTLFNKEKGVRGNSKLVSTNKTCPQSQVEGTKCKQKISKLRMNQSLGLAKESAPKKKSSNNNPFERLYRQSKMNQNNQKKQSDKAPSRAMVFDPELFDRLYASSTPMQEAGKKRRESIMKARVKKEWIPDKRKISPDKADRLYHEGMKHLAALERRRVERELQDRV